jgi:polyisoprenoid-binding protein YceI
MNWKRWLIIGAITAAVAAVAGPWLYINVIEGDAPAPLTAASADGPQAAGALTSDSSARSGATDGTWNVTSGSLVGYRVNEVLFGQSTTAVGRTTDIAGTMQIDGTTIESASFTVQMASITSDQQRRDGQFNGRIMDTSTYPTSMFVLSDPITFSSVPAGGSPVTKTVTGELTLHGTTKQVKVDLTGARNGATITVKGAIPIVFADWNIPNPSFGPVTTEDHGILEFALNFGHA